MVPSDLGMDDLCFASMALVLRMVRFSKGERYVFQNELATSDEFTFFAQRGHCCSGSMLVSMRRMTLAGLPAAKWKGGTSYHI